MPGVNFDLLRERISIVDVLRLLDLTACGRQGDQLRGPCPVHGSSSPQSRSFTVNVRLGRYPGLFIRTVGQASSLSLEKTGKMPVLHQPRMNNPG
jgi:hypothetical protein